MDIIIIIIYNGYRVFPGGKAAGAWRWTPTPSQCRGHESLLTLWASVACYRENLTPTFIIICLFNDT